MFFSRRKTQLPSEIEGMPVFQADEPFVLSNDDEILRLKRSDAASFIRICKFGIYGRSTSYKWFKHIRDIIDCAEEEYGALETDYHIQTPVHRWGLVPLDSTIKTKIRTGYPRRREAFFDHRLLPKGYLLGCEVERIEITGIFDRDLESPKEGYADPEEYSALRRLMESHVTSWVDLHEFTHADLSPEQCAITPEAGGTKKTTYLFDIEPVVIPSSHYPIAKS